MTCTRPWPPSCFSYVDSGWTAVNAFEHAYCSDRTEVNMAAEEDDEDIWDSWEDVADSGVRDEQNYVSVFTLKRPCNCVRI